MHETTETNDMQTRVLAAIVAGARTNKAIQVAVLGKVADVGYARAVDAALQKLKKAGRIVYRDRQWFPADAPKPCRRCGGSGEEPARG